MNILIVGIGGAAGAILRYAISMIPFKSTFPLLTFITNILGAAAIGFIAGSYGRRTNMSAQTLLLLKTGFCGGFTTFSTFSLETYNLICNRHYVTAGFYVLLSIVCCILGVVAGQYIANKI